MLPSQCETFISQEWRGIDQLPRVDSSREAKKLIHNRQPHPSVESGNSLGWHAKIRE
jgi:hypothetical protein